MNKALRTVLIILLLPFALIFLCTAVTSLRAGWRHYGAMAYADTIATQLGYTQQTHLVKERRCYNSWIDGETCEAVIMFTSPLDKEHFDQQVQAVNTGEHLYFGVKPVESDFSDLFYLISSLDKPVLTIDGRIPDMMIQFLVGPRPSGFMVRQEPIFSYMKSVVLASLSS